MKIKGFGEGEFSAISMAELRLRLRLGSAARGLPKSVAAVSTGSLALDRATGSGGVPKGFLSVVGGVSLERNRAMAFSMVAAVQTRGGRVVVVDSTKHLWTSFKQHHEIDKQRVAFLETDGPVASVLAARALVALDKVDLVLIGPLVGSAAGATPLAWMLRNSALAGSLRGNLEELVEATRSSSTAVVVLHGGVSETSPISWLSQAKERLAGLSKLDFNIRALPSRRGGGDPIIIGGLFQVDVIGESGQIFDHAKVEIRPGGGVSRMGDILEYAMADGVVRRHGSVYKTTDGVMLGRGRAAAKEMLGTGSGAGTILMSAHKQGGAEAAQRYFDILAEAVPKPSSASLDKLLAGLVEDGRAKAPAARVEYEPPPAEASSGSEPSETKDGDLPPPDDQLVAPPSVDRAPPESPRRSLNTWFEGPGERLPPLIAGRTYEFKFQIARKKTRRKGGKATKFVEPDFGRHLSVPLIATLYGRDFEITQRHHQFELDRVDDSEVLTTEVVPLHKGACRIRLAISLQRELELLQVVRVEIEAIEAVEEVQPEGEP